MSEIKLAVTQEKREETIDKILNLIETEFEGIEVTVSFTKTLLEETLRTLEFKCYSAPLKAINHILDNKD